MRSYDELLADRLRTEHQPRATQHSEAPRSAQPSALLRLQQQAGNQAVQRLVQREIADAPAKSKPAWSHGPTSTRKRVSHTLAEYIGWVREVEQAYGENHAEIVQRLRRVYYSNLSGVAGSRFDLIINKRWSMLEPLSSPPLRIETLNGLYETDYIITPSGGKLDVSHLFAGLDVSLTGGSAVANTVGASYALRSREVSWAGVLTWVGDLASWFREWVAKKHAQEDQEQRTLSEAEHQSLLLRLTGAKVDKDDLLGDMDAHVMAQRYATLATHRDPFASSLEDPVSVISTLSAPVSSILETFYQPQPGASATTHEINRFALFVRAARPTIPHEVIQADPLRVRLADDAKAVIHRYIADTARVFLEVGGGDKRYTTDEVLTRYDHILWNIAWYFVRFLNTGLERGDAPWP